MTLLIEIALVALAALGVVAAVLAMPDGEQGAEAGRRRRRGAALPRPDQAVQLERMVSFAQHSALEVHAHLRPVLAEIAARRLAARGQALKSLGPEAGTRLLGAPLWELVRPDRPFPEDRQGPGLSPEELADMVETLERL